MSSWSNVRRVAVLLSIAAIGVSGGCASTGAPRAPRAGLPDTAVPASQLRLQVRALAHPFTGIIEAAGDRILLAATTPEERVTGLRFKANAVPMFHNALFDSDPMAAAFDTAALIEQTRTYLDTGPGSALPDETRDAVFSALAAMRDRLYELTPSIADTVEAGERFWAAAENWARSHPIDSTFSVRQSAHGLFADFIENESSGILSLARRTELTVTDLAARVNLHAIHLPKQIRWQSELMLEESLLLDYPQRAVDSLGPIPIGIDELPVDIPEERRLLLEALREERLDTLRWLNRERLDTQAFVRAERVAIADLLAAERAILLTALVHERDEAIAAIDDQRRDTLEELSGSVPVMISAAGTQVVDHLMWRLAQLLMVALPVCFCGAWFLIWFARR